MRLHVTTLALGLLLITGCESPPPRATTRTPEPDYSQFNKYDRELLRWQSQMDAKFRQTMATLPAGARYQFEIDYNAKYPAWKAEVVDRLRAMEREDRTAQALDLAKAGRTDDAYTVIALGRRVFGPTEEMELRQKVAEAAAATNTERVRSILREIAKEKGWPAAAATLKDPGFQEKEGLSLSQAADIMTSILPFLNENPPSEPRPPQ